MTSTSDQTANVCAAALGECIAAISNAHESHWYVLFLKPSDYAGSIDTTTAKDEEEKKKLIALQTRLKALYPRSLEARTSLGTSFNKACISIGLVQQRNDGPRVIKKNWEKLLDNLKIDYEIVTASPSSGFKGQHWYLRLGPKSR